MCLLRLLVGHIISKKRFLFVDFKGKLRFRGTSGLFRVPKARIQHLSPDRRRKRTSSSSAEWKRTKFDTSGHFDSSFVSPAKSEMSLPSISSENEDSTDHRFSGLCSGNMTNNANSKRYQLAMHSVSVRRSGLIGDVADIWQAQGQVQKTPVKPHLNRLKSIKAFDKKSFANEMLEGLRYFVRERKSEPTPKPAYNWGSTGTGYS